MPLTLENLRKAREAGLDDDRIVASIERNDPELAERFNNARSQGLDNKRILSAFERRLSSNAPTTQPKDVTASEGPLNASNDHRGNLRNVREQPIATPDSRHLEQPYDKNAIDTSTMLPGQPGHVPGRPGYGDYFAQGLRHSATGEITNIGQPDQQIAEDPNFWQALVQESGNIAGDAPFMFAGSILGATAGSALGSFGGPVGTAAGALLGGGAGALALPEFLKASLQEYRDYAEAGNDLTFGEFLERADRVGSKTINSGIMGAILGTLNKAAPLLKEIPGIGSLFTSKIAQTAGMIGAETATLATVPAITKGELPTANDFASALALVLGFNAAKIPSAIKEK